MLPSTDDVDEKWERDLLRLMGDVRGLKRFRISIQCHIEMGDREWGFLRKMNEAVRESEEVEVKWCVLENDSAKSSALKQKMDVGMEAVFGKESKEDAQPWDIVWGA